MKPLRHDSCDTRGHCRPIKELISKLGSKWTVMVVTQLRAGPKRFNEMKRDIGDISQKMLAATLRDLEHDGFVRRTVTPTIPPRVDYELTGLGQDLLQPIEFFGNWVIANHHRVVEARGKIEGEPG
jgi:DNA-binding HxlR family transcriptional regulator